MNKSGVARASLVNFACFQCRKTFKRPFEKGKWTRVCPSCKGTEMLMGTKWRSPKNKDTVQWEIIELFVKSGHGFKFWDENLRRIPFPKTIKKAHEILGYLSDRSLLREARAKSEKFAGAKKVRKIERVLKKSDRKKKKTAK